MAAKVPVSVACAVCGDVRTHEIDFDNDADIAAIGIDVCEAVRRGHVMLVAAGDARVTRESMN